MDDKIKKYLLDILESISSIDDHMMGNRNYKVYLSSKYMRRCAERELEIIGEALKRILKYCPNIAISSPSKIVGQRKFIAYACDRVVDEIIWAVVIEHLPVLKKEVEQFLSEVDSNAV